MVGGPVRRTASDAEPGSELPGSYKENTWLHQRLWAPAAVDVPSNRVRRDKKTPDRPAKAGREAWERRKRSALAACFGALDGFLGHVLGTRRAALLDLRGRAGGLGLVAGSLVLRAAGVTGLQGERDRYDAEECNEFFHTPD